MPRQPSDILLDKYRIEALIGQGAFAEVYRVTHLALNAPRALKILRRDAPGMGSSEYHDFRARFQLEAQLGARLDHPHIIRVYDFEQDGETLILAMEYAEGGSLAEKINQARAKDRPVPIAEAVQIALDIANGLSALHALDAVHRDLKPSNILFDRAGRAKVADVGLAQIPGGPSMRSQLSQAAPHPGTPGYMSPEQESISAYLTPASDVYALGLVLFEMLSGRVYHSQRPGTRAGDLRPDVPRWLDDLLARMLARLPEERPWGGGEAAGLLRAGQKQEAEERERQEAAARARREAEERERREAAASARREAEEREREEQQARERSRLEQDIEAALADKDWRQVKRLIARLEVLGEEGRSEAARQRERLPGFGARLPAWTWVVAGGFVVLGIIVSIVMSGRPAVVPTMQLTNTPQPTFTPTVQPTRITDDHGVPVVLVPAGAFEMGGDADIALAECQKLFIGGDCQRDWFTDEERIHTVTLEDYYIDQYEVTNARYKACVDAGVCDPPGEVSSYTRSSYYGNSQYDDYPVIYVSWDDAKAYCEWRGARLPTEAEWEKAARGGLEGKLYPWGDGFDGSRANFCDRNCTYNWANKDYNDGYADTAPAGSYAPNGYGLYDMAGNVWEWVADWYDGGYYGVSPSNNPTGPSTGEYRVLRGGSWLNYGDLLRVANRSGYDPSSRFNFIGFRCALSP